MGEILYRRVKSLETQWHPSQVYPLYSHTLSQIKHNKHPIHNLNTCTVMYEAHTRLIFLTDFKAKARKIKFPYIQYTAVAKTPLTIRKKNLLLYILISEWLIMQPWCCTSNSTSHYLILFTCKVDDFNWKWLLFIFSLRMLIGIKCKYLLYKMKYKVSLKYHFLNKLHFNFTSAKHFYWIK